MDHFFTIDGVVEVFGCMVESCKCKFHSDDTITVPSFMTCPFERSGLILCMSCRDTALDENALRYTTTLSARALANEIIARNTQHYVQKCFDVEVTDGAEMIIHVDADEEKSDVWVSTTRGVVSGPGELSVVSHGTWVFP